MSGPSPTLEEYKLPKNYVENLRETRRILNIPYPPPIDAEWAKWHRLKVIGMWLRNLPGLPNRLMAYWLRSRGWVVFYLDKQAQHCTAVCWLEEYKRSEKK